MFICVSEKRLLEVTACSSSFFLFLGMQQLKERKCHDEKKKGKERKVIKKEVSDLWS